MLKINSIVSKNISEIVLYHLSIICVSSIYLHLSIYLPVQSDNRYRHVEAYAHTQSLGHSGYLYKIFISCLKDVFEC